MRRAMFQSALVFASVLAVVALAGCGGGGGKTVSTMPPDLPAGSETVAAGEVRTVWDTGSVRTDVTCPVGGEACVITVAEDGAVTSVGGGAPTIELVPYTVIDLPAGHDLETGDTIAAGGVRTVRDADGMRTDVRCSAGGKDCKVRVTEDGAVQWSGGAPAATTYAVVDLPQGHTLTADTTVPAGGTRGLTYSRGRSRVLVCPEGGEDCYVEWVSDRSAEATGGAPVVETRTNEMVWQANNGPGGTSDGGHARGLEGRIQFGNFLDDFFRLTNNGVATRVGVNVQGSPDPDPTVTPSVEWTRGASPRLGLTLGAAAISSLDLSALGPNLGRLSVDRGSTIPSLGTGWNGVALTRRYANARADATGGKTVHAVLYSNIERAVGGTPDGHYLLLGSWLTMPDDSGAASTEYDWAVFADGNPASRLTQAQVIALTGTVQYEGPATGLYLMSTYTGSGFSRPLTGSKVGSFTATARVTADFGTSSAVGSFGGSVTNFMENGESLGDWSVTMPSTMTTISGNDVLYVGATAGTTGTSNLTGSWGVQFYSDGATDGGWAAGTFTAATAANNNEGLRIAGSYGATKQ